MAIPIRSPDIPTLLIWVSTGTTAPTSGRTVVSGEGPDGELLSGWHARNCHLPARVSEEHSKTAYTTDVGIEFIRGQGDNPGFLHLSYIKPY